MVGQAPATGEAAPPCLEGLRNRAATKSTKDKSDG